MNFILILLHMLAIFWKLDSLLASGIHILHEMEDQ
jgi:hypothetical protein